MYEAFYNLTARPFQLMPDPRLLFESRDHKRALSYLLYGLERREGFVVITGDVGMGKTLLVQMLLGELRTRDLLIARVATANLDASAILPTVASAFGLPHKSRSKIELLEDLVARMMTTGSRGALLIVDEAQTCTREALEELRAVSNLQADGRALIQVFLVGQTDLREMLIDPRMAHLRQRIVASHHLVPLDGEEVRAYIQHRLTRVGWKNNPRLDEEIYPQVHEWSRGVPRRINNLMDRLLLYGYLERRKVLSVEDLQAVISEFDDEFADESLLAGGMLKGGGSGQASSNARLDLLNERLAALEQGLTSALGRTRVAQLLDKHQAHAESREVIEAQMRITRLEGIVAELRRPQAVKPKTLEPETVKPEAVKPETVEPETVEPETVEPETVEPETVEPETVEPETVEPETVEPEAVGPEAVGPETLEQKAAGKAAARRKEAESRIADARSTESQAPSSPSLAAAIDAITSFQPTQIRHEETRPGRWNFFGRKKKDDH